MAHTPAPPDRLGDVISDMARAFHAPGPGLPGWLGQELTLAQVRTLFLIAHDAPLPMGRIAEHGTHDELVARNGFYADLYNSQFVEALDEAV